jgi:hypothetical protein
VITPRYHDFSVNPTGEGGGPIGSVGRALKKFVANAFVVRSPQPRRGRQGLRTVPHRPRYDPTRRGFSSSGERAGRVDGAGSRVTPILAATTSGFTCTSPASPSADGSPEWQWKAHTPGLSGTMSATTISIGVMHGDGRCASGAARPRSRASAGRASRSWWRP